MKNKQKQIIMPNSQLNTTLIDEIGAKSFFLNKSITLTRNLGHET
jgi:hypothetical protein